MVNDFAHASMVAFVALAQTVDARPVRSAATTSPIGADATDPHTEHKRQPSIIIEIDHSHHPQQALARHELTVVEARASQQAQLKVIDCGTVIKTNVRVWG